MNADPFDRLHRLRDENDQHAATMAANSERFDKLRTRHEDGTAPRAVTAHQLFQTPRSLAARMVDLANLRPGLRTLEPSAGLGRILDAMAEHAPTDQTAVEVSADLCRELYNQDRPNVRILQRDFLTTTGKDFVMGFDRILMNPPFTMRADIRHTLHALQFLRPGGVLVGLAMNGAQRHEKLQPLADHWEILPAGTFREAGTNIETILFTIKNP